jgi:hypothetical protein
VGVCYNSTNFHKHTCIHNTDEFCILKGSLTFLVSMKCNVKTNEIVTFLGSSVALGTVSPLRQEQVTCWCVMLKVNYPIVALLFRLQLLNYKLNITMFENVS